MTENIRQAKIQIDSENYEKASQFLDKELEQNPNKNTNDIFYYKGIVLTYKGTIKKDKFLIESGIQYFEKLIASKLDRDLIHYPDAKKKLKEAKEKLIKLKLENI